jgi:phage terminase large subunit-like protein
VPTFERVVVGIDPAVTASDASDETGIIAAGIDGSGNTWVLEDRSGRYTADGWATTAVELAQKWGARLLVETNQGGDLVVDAIRRVSRHVRVTRVTAVASKEARAVPVAQLYERARGVTADPVVVHLPGLSILEDQMTT